MLDRPHSCPAHGSHVLSRDPPASRSQGWAVWHDTVWSLPILLYGSGSFSVGKQGVEWVLLALLTSLLPGTGSCCVCECSTT